MLKTLIAAGLFVGSSFAMAQDAHDHSAHGGHATTVEYEDHAPEVVVVAHVDSMQASANVFLSVNGAFHFDPENEGSAHVEKSGHAHVYTCDADGEHCTKRMRLYQMGWFHVPSEWLHQGGTMIRVVLSANNHAEYVHEGEPIVGEATVTVEKQGAHQH